MEQLSLFDLDKMVEVIQNEPATPALAVSAPITPAVTPKKVKPEIPVKPTLSESTIKQLNSIMSIADLCHLADTNTVQLDIGSGWRFKAYECLVDVNSGYSGAVAQVTSYNTKGSNNLAIKIHIEGHYEHSEKQTMVFFDKFGNAWGRVCNLDFCPVGDSKWHMKFSWEGSKWRILTSLPSDGVIFMQTEHTRRHIFHDAMPYTFKYYQEGGHDKFSLGLLMMCPQLELLDKAGYKFVNQLSYYPQNIDINIVTSFNRLIKFEKNPGKLQNIFKTTKEVCKILKEEKRLDIWNQLRKLEKFSKTSPDEIQVIYDSHYSDKDLNNIQNILKQQYHNKNVFTFTSLVNYLNRLDQYEAIGVGEALQLIKDYLESCRLLDMEPRIDGDSLKREHDVAARLVREKRNEIEAKRMVEGCKKLQQYNYENDRYIIRGVRNYDDLLDEAKQQHNCVASYSSRIASGSSLIFVMRRKTVPDRSFVTIELSPDLSTVRQKYEAHNQPLRNKDASDFIDEWQRHCKDVKKGIVQPHILDMDKTGVELIHSESDSDKEAEEDIDI